MRVIKTYLQHDPGPRLPLHDLEHTSTNHQRSNQLLRKIALPTMEGFDFERIQDIISVEAKGNYALLYFKNNKKLLVCKTLRDIEEMINSPAQFVRIHRSFTINLNCIKKYIKGKGGYVIMEDDSTISVSTGRKQGFMDALKFYFG